MKYWWLGLVVACGGTVTPVAKPARVADAEQGARDLMAEAYGTLRRGNAQGLAPLLEPDVFWINADSNEPVERATALLTFDEKLSDGKTKLSSRDLVVHTSHTGQAAWTHDRIDVAGRSLTLSAVLVQRDELWTVAAIVWGQAASGPSPKAPKAAKSRRKKGEPAPALPAFDGDDAGGGE